MATTNVTETFTGPDGSLPNRLLWDNAYGYNNYSIQSNKLQLDLEDAPNYIGGIISRFHVSGDFSIQVDYTTSDVAADNSLTVLQVASVADEDDRCRIAFLNYDTVADFFRAQILGTGATATNDTASVLNGKFKLVRTGSNVACSYYDSTWQLVDTLSWLSGDVKIQLIANIGTSYPAVTTTFDNLTVTADSILKFRTGKRWWFGLKV